MLNDSKVRQINACRIPQATKKYKKERIGNKMLQKIKKAFHVILDKRIASVLMAIAMVLSSFTFTLAANGGAGDKAINLHGYYFVENSSTTTSDNYLNIYLDKNITGFDSNMITITDVSTNQPLTFTTSTSLYSGGGWTHTGSSGGKTITIIPNSSTPLKNSTEYKVTVSGCISSANTYHWLLGSYLAHHDITFYVYTPKNDGTYNTHTPIFSYIPNGAYNVGESNNPTIICDIPFSNISVTPSQVSLWQENVKNSGDFTQTLQDDNFTDHSPLDGYLGYTTQINDAGNCIFIPLTLGGTGTPNYNLLTNRNYQLRFPTTMDSNHSDGKLGFTTGAENPASMGATQPVLNSYTYNQDGLTADVSLTWANITSSSFPYGSLPDHYKIYYSTTSPYFGFDNCLGTYAYNNQASDTETVNVPKDVTCYFRIVPVYNGQEGGFSLHVQAP